MKIDAKKILQAAELVVKEYNFNPTETLEIIKMGLKTAFRKDYLPKNKKIQIETVIDKSGTIKFYKVLEIVATEEEIENPFVQILPEEWKEYKKDVKIWEKIYEDITPDDLAFSRIAVQAGTQTIKQQIKRIEKERFYQRFKDREGEILVGKVRFVSGDIVVLEIWDSTVILPPNWQLPNKTYLKWEMINVLLKKIRKSGSDIILEVTQSAPEFIEVIMKRNIPEIEQWLVNIEDIVRFAGIRSKVLVSSDDDRIDPAGVCIGEWGNRIMNIVNDLEWERVDIIEATDNQEQLIIKAFLPARISTVVIEGDNATVYVDPDQKPLAFGRKMANLKLVSKLTGYKIRIE